MDKETTYVKELINKEDLIKAFPVMKQLRTHLDEEMYSNLIEEMKKEGYKMFALYVQEEIVVVALSSGLQLAEAHKFYESKMGFDKTSYVFEQIA